jgi:hypothetical protein
MENVTVVTSILLIVVSMQVIALPSMCDVTFDSYKVGDGKCNREGKFFTSQCLYDGGDCCKDELLSKGFDVDLVGNGFCNGGVYSYACDNDEAGDCTRAACDLKLAETGKGTYSIVVKDVRNGDGFPDIIIGNYGESNQLLLNKGDGTFNDPAVLPEGLTSTYSIAVKDINGNAWPDIVIGNNGDTNQSLMNKGNGTFKDQAIDLPGGDMLDTRSIVIADINGDGWPDIIVGNDSEHDESSRNQIMLNDGTGTFPEAQDSPLDAGIYTNSIVVEDVNGDGGPDIILGTRWGKNQILMNTDNGSFDEPVDLPGGRMVTDVIAVNDVNGDGAKDLVVENSKDKSNQLLINNGDGTFQEPVILPGGIQTFIAL